MSLNMLEICFMCESQPNVFQTILVWRGLWCGLICLELAGNLWVTGQRNKAAYWFGCQWLTISAK